MIAPEQFLLCVGASLVIGLVLCAMMLWRTRPSTGFAVTLATLPAVVCVVIMMVNGKGAGVAVAGAFSLVRFRSAPGSAREIGAIFAAMGAGLMAGMGYLGYAALFAPDPGRDHHGLPRPGSLAAETQPCAAAPCTSPFRRIWTTPASLTRFWHSMPPSLS